MNPIRFALMLKNVRHALAAGWIAMIGAMIVLHMSFPFVALSTYFAVMALVTIAEKLVMKKYAIPASLIGESARF